MFYFMTIIGLTSAYIGGMHDGGTVVATAISSRLLSPRKAVLLAGCANLLGAILLGTAVAHTMAGDIVDISPVLSGSRDTGYTFVAAAFTGGILWNVFTWIVKLPSSASHSLIGALIGSGIIAYGGIYIHWHTVLFKVILAMLLSPVVGFVIGFFFTKLGKIMLKNGTMAWSKRINRIGRISSLLLAFCYGSNDSQKAMGIIAIGLAAFYGGQIEIPLWLILACSLALATGTITGGYNMIKTVGMDICKIDNRSAFSSQLSTVFVVITANLTGLPISATQVVTASVMGVGTENTPKGVNWNITKKILAAWIITLPVAALMGAAAFLLLALI